jgi:hypothetical protein
VERSIAQAAPGDGRPEPDRDEDESTESVEWRSLAWGLAIVALCLAAYVLIHPGRSSFYIHFVWQAQAWLDGQTSIPTGIAPTSTSPGNNYYQDIQPILDQFGMPTGRGIIPFPPLPALALVPFTAIWHLDAGEQMLAAVFGAVDVGLAYWMLGYLPIKPSVRGLTSLFFGLGTALFYTSAIGTTWFWAHVVALGCLIPAVGLALSADRAAALPRSGALRRAATLPEWPGGWHSAACLIIMGALAATLLQLAGGGAPAWAVAGTGLLTALAAAALAVTVTGRPGVLLTYLVVVTLVCGIPGAFLLRAWTPGLQLAVNAVVGVVAALVAVASWRGSERLDAALLTAGRALTTPEARQVAAGLLFGLACCARLTILFGFPFLLLVGGGRTWLRRGLLAGAGAAVPLLALVTYTYASTGHIFNPAYEYLYHLELGYPFGYHADWAIEDIRYVPQNLGIFLLNGPLMLPQTLPMRTEQLCAEGQARGLFDVSCPLAMPDPFGMSILLTSPAYLLAPFAYLRTRARGLDRAVVGATLAVVAIAFVNLMHFSQGWVQFGYRFANDFAPFALILVALGATRLRAPWLLALLVGFSIAVNFWGVIWGVNLGW